MSTRKSASRLSVPDPSTSLDAANKGYVDSQIGTREPTVLPGTSAQYLRGDKTWQTLDASAVGLGNVNNTADSAKNVLSATKLTTTRSVRTNLASTSAVNFDGTANITPGVTGTLPIANGGTGNTTGLAATATKLATPRNINGVAFDGSADITLPAASIGWVPEIVVNSAALAAGYNDVEGGVLVEPGPNGNGVLLDAIAVRIGDAATNLSGGDLQIQIQLGSPTSNQDTLVTTITLTNGTHDLVAVLGSPVACIANTVLRANIVIGSATLTKSLYIQYRGRYA